MGLVTDLLYRFKELQAEREPWSNHWFDISKYTLPDAERFDAYFADADRATAVDSVVSEPVAARRTREVYDMTSLWAIDRGAAGLISLKTPQTTTWHDLGSDDPFAGEATDDEKRWYELARDYLFSIRANPQSGFWVAHKAAIRSVWAFGTAVMFVEQGKPNLSAPIGYRHVPLSQCHLAADYNGLIDTNFRLFKLSARQCVQKLGQGNVSAKTLANADDPKKKDKPVSILHAVYPRAEAGSKGNTNKDAPWASCHIEVDEKHLIGESGFWQFPFRVDHWQRNNTSPYAEGPVAICLAEIKSLNLLSKSILRASQQMTDPPTGEPNDALPRLNLNPRARNPGAVNAQGQLLVHPIITAQRPDFAESVRAASRSQVEKTLYVHLWQTLIEPAPGETATAALIRNQERGELLGPVGTSLDVGLSHQVDREIGILSNRGAFAPGSPLEAPQSVQGKGVSARFTSPLDKARRLPEFQATQLLWQFAGQLAQEGSPQALDKLDADQSMDLAQDILGAPRKVMADDKTVAAKRQQRENTQRMQMGIAATQGAADAGQSAVAAVDAASKSPAAIAVLNRLVPPRLNRSSPNATPGQPLAPAPAGRPVAPPG